jgi:hypothetical protein
MYVPDTKFFLLDRQSTVLHGDRVKAVKTR